MTAKRLCTIIVLGLALNLAGCGGFVADHWPHWAGGLPADAPPRPGTPGYADFVAHGQVQPEVKPEAKTETASTTSPQQPAVSSATASAPVAAGQPPSPPATRIRAADPSDEVPEDTSVVKGGLY
jgi:hypothetical protein